MPWKHEKAGASPVAATISVQSKHAGGKSRPGVHIPGNLERYQGLRPLSSQVLSRQVDCKPTVSKYAGR